jgi:multidrug resistance efflux pump
MRIRNALLMWGVPAVGLIGLAGGATMVALDQPEIPSEEPDRLPPVSPSAGAFIGGTGLVEPSSESIEIGTPVAGVVEELAVSVGDAVSVGQPLFRVETRTVRAELDRQRSELAVAEAALAETLADVPPAEARVSQAEAQLAAANAQVKQAAASVQSLQAARDDRQNQLNVAENAGGAKAIGSQELETRRASLRSADANLAGGQSDIAAAEAQVKRAEAQLDEARATLAQLADDGPRVRSARASVRRAEAALAATQVELDRRTVTAPVEGRVLQVNLRLGEYASSGGEGGGNSDPLMVVGDVTPLHVRGQIDEFDIARFNPAAAAYATPRGDGDRQVRLGFVRVEPLVVPKRNLTGGTSERIDTRVLEIVYAVPPGEEGLFVGQQVDLFIAAEGGE